MPLNYAALCLSGLFGGIPKRVRVNPDAGGAAGARKPCSGLAWRGRRRIPGAAAARRGSGGKAGYNRGIVYPRARAPVLLDSDPTGGRAARHGAPPDLAAWAEAFASLSGEVLIMLDPQLRVLHWPEAAELLLGWPPARALGFGLGSVLSLPAATQAALREAIASRATLAGVVLPARRIGGVGCRIRASLQPVVAADGGLIGAAVVLRADDAPSDPSDPPGGLAPLLAALPLPLAVVDAAGTVRHATPLASAVLGLAAGRPCCPALCSRHGSGCRTRRVLQGQGPLYWECEADGRHYDVTASALAGDAVLYCGLPVSDPLAPELRKFYRAVNENTSGVLIADQAGRIEYANPRASEILGYSLPELTGRDVRSFGHNPELLAIVSRQPPLRQGTAEIGILRRDGSERRVRVAISDIRDPDGRIGNWVFLFDDVSERRALEAKEAALREQLAHASRLAAVGEITSMIAHEINQPLATIANYGRGMQLRLERGRLEDGLLREALEAIVGEVGRADQIIRNVRDLARRRQPSLQVVDPNALLSRNLPVFRLLAGAEGGRVQLALDPAAGRVTMDPLQIEQVLVNLVKNALEAGGALPAARRGVTVRSRADAGGVVFEVEDRAPMPPANLVDRLGEPFFSTKPDGLGLGLSITRTLLEAHGARLAIRPLAPDGKCFHFTLRCAEVPDDGSAP